MWVGLGCLWLLAAASASAETKWNRVDSAHFVVIGDVGSRDLRDVALRFEQFREVLTRLLPDAKWTTSAPTEVVVFNSSRSFKPYKFLGPNSKPSEDIGAF